MASVVTAITRYLCQVALLRAITSEKVSYDKARLGDDPGKVVPTTCGAME